MKDFKLLWSEINTAKTKEEIDSYSISEIKTIKEIYENYFSQIGHNIDCSTPLIKNYIIIKKKINKLSK